MRLNCSLEGHGSRIRLMCNGIKFHCLAAQKEKNLSPNILVRVIGTEILTHKSTVKRKIYILSFLEIKFSNPSTQYLKV